METSAIIVSKFPEYVLSPEYHRNICGGLCADDVGYGLSFVLVL